MDNKTIQTLNELNQKFYETVGSEFDRTRQQYWEGWDTFLPHLNLISDSNMRVLDVACGNSRFGRFLDEYLPTKQIEYVGIEREPQLLSLADSALKPTHLHYRLENNDIVENLLNKNLSNTIRGTYDLIVVFGLLHHIPSQQLREELIAILTKTLKPNGLLIVSSWQFARLPRFSERFVEPQVAGMNDVVLEKNDYILDWKRAIVAYRYCHFADETELKELLNITSDLDIIDSYYADGKTHSLNCYVIGQKKA